jgi:transcriptional regulator with XRE-family HTH domain
VDDIKVGSVIRAVRIRRGMTQAQLAATAGISRSMVSLIEGGRFDRACIATVRRVGLALGVSLPIEPRWRGADLAKLLDESHAAVVREVTARLTALGWEVVPECTFSVWGEKGSIDIFAWHAAARALLTLEVKTKLADLQDLLSTMDRKRRLGPTLARDRGWRPLMVGSVLVLPEATWARNAIARFGPVFRSALPAHGAEVRRWLRQPERDLRGIWFLLYDTPGGTKGRSRGVMRVRRRRLHGPAPISRSASPVAAGDDESVRAVGAGRSPNATPGVIEGVK